MGSHARALVANSGLALGATARLAAKVVPFYAAVDKRFFANLTDKQLRRGVHRSTSELEAAIRGYIDTVNAGPRPFTWTKSVDDILNSVKRFRLATRNTAEIQTEISGISEPGH